ncbi:hypothetical protein WICMUC_000749 [Wickerhamomyces mucosus]|uniref:VPS37 C-terminal domain-containing protein n=1 Tax=Wickerhamomyces mucosus TaxID=1378264 RepID=A0A9P8PWQ1_9ASCO|nr:hypothetical protein WICMUC_000749 [Wickerhamomyces mucosus]
MDTPPSLPPKPTSEISNEPSTSKTSNKPSSSSSFISNSINNGNLKKSIPLPKSFNLLPTSEINKLTNSLNILKGYLITLYQDEFNKNLSDLNLIVEKINEYLIKLQKLNDSKLEISNKLNLLKIQVEEWELIESNMYKSLQKFSNENLGYLLTIAVQDSKKLSESIQSNFITHSNHNDESIQQFIKDFTKERKLYYLRNEKLQRFNENRIGGI